MTKDYTGVLLEEINSKVDIILEATTALKDVPTKLQVIDERLVNVETDVKAMKAVLTETNQDHKQHHTKLANHERRITHLEKAT